MAKPSSSWKDYVMYRRKVIERSNDDEEKLLNIQKLQKVPITIELLQETGIGRVLRELCKEDGEVGERAKLLMTKWKGVVAKYKASNNKSEEIISNGDKSSTKLSEKIVSVSRKPANGHSRNNGAFSTEHSLYAKKHKQHSASAADMDKIPSKDSGFYEGPDFDQTASQRHMVPDEFNINGVDDESSYEEENVPYNGNEASKYTSYSDHVQFGENEYNPEFPALYSTSKHHQLENKNINSYEQAEEEHLTGTQNGILSSHVASDKSAAKHRSSNHVKHSSSSTKQQESRKLKVSPSKYQSSSYVENISGSSKVKRDKQYEDSSQKRRYESQTKLQDISKTKEKNLFSPEKHHSFKSGSPSQTLPLKRKHNEESNSFLKNCSSRSSSPASRSSSSGAEKCDDQNSQQLHKKIKEVESYKKFKESSKVSKTSSSGSSKSSLGNHSSKSSSFLQEITPKESNKIVKAPEKRHKETSSHKSKTSCKSPSSSTSKTSNAKSSLSTETEGFTSTEASFEDCLGFNDIVSVKKKKPSKQSSAAPHSPKDKIKKNSCSKELSKASAESSIKTTGSSSHSKSKELSKSKSTSKPQANLLDDNSKKKKKSKILSESPDAFEVPKPTEMEVDIMSTLPEIQPNYKPLPSYRLDSPPQKRTTALTDEEAIMFTSSRKEKTAVYSGRKSHYATEVLQLQELCTRVLIENIDGIGFIGGVPYMILKPVLERCTAKQLYTIEDFNAYLLEDTGELWKQHCMRTYRRQHPEAGETWRDLYIRLHDEQESKLRSVTRNISVSMSRATPVRQTKLAYVDSVVKPPRDVARKQAKHGTALPVNHTMKTGPPSKASPRPTAPAINAAASSKPGSPIPPSSNNSGGKVVKRTAPLMMKTLKDLKKAFRR